MQDVPLERLEAGVLRLVGAVEPAGGVHHEVEQLHAVLVQRQVPGGRKKQKTKKQVALIGISIFFRLRFKAVMIDLLCQVKLYRSLDAGCKLYPS